MAKEVIIFSNVVDNKLARNRTFLASAICEYNGKEIYIKIGLKTKKHSDVQRGYYFGVIVSLIREAIFNEWGDKMTSNEVHELLKTNCNYKEKVNKRTGEIIEVAGSIKQHTTSEQEDYHEDCRRWAKEWFNIDIPLPNEQIEIQVD